MHRIRMCFLIVAISAGLTVLAGCQETATERRGYSPIPQNRPASWETNPMQGIPN